jgi:hypothetical protein
MIIIYLILYFQTTPTTPTTEYNETISPSQVSIITGILVAIVIFVIDYKIPAFQKDFLVGPMTSFDTSSVSPTI